MSVPYTIPWERQIHTKVYISRPDGVTWVDVAPYTKSIQYSSGIFTRFGSRIAGIDGVAPQLELVLHNTQDAKFNPQLQDSPWNVFNGEYAPLLDGLREIQVLTAVTAPGETPEQEDWIGLFHGYIGDRVKVSETGSEITISCRSLMQRLMEAYIEDPKEYGSEEGTPLEVVMQQIIDDNLGSGQVELYCPEPTGYMIYPYPAEEVQYKTVWDVLQTLASAYDFYLGDRWDPITQKMRLTLLVPPRDKDVFTADFILNYRSDFYREERDVKHTSIRNVIIGHYWDAETNQRRTVKVQDDASIQRYWRRAMEIEESATSLINTEEEMLALLNGVLQDLKDPQGTVYLEMPFFPQIDLFSGLVIHHPHMSSTDDFIGVESYSHVLDFPGKKFRTEIIGSGRVRGGQQKWLKNETRPGKPAQPSPPPTSNVPPANVIWGTCSIITEINLNWVPVKGAVAYEIRGEDANWGSEEGLIFKGNATTHREPIKQRNNIFYIKAINSAGLYSEEAAVITLDLPAPKSPPPPTVEEFFKALKITVHPGNEPSIVGYNLYITNTQTQAEEVIPLAGATTIAYEATANVPYVVRTSARDVLGEGAKSSPVQATPVALSKEHIPAELIEPGHLVDELRRGIDGAITDSRAALGLISDLDSIVDDTIADLNAAKDRLTSAETEITGAKNRLASVETEVAGAKSRLSDAEDKLGTIDVEIAEAKDRISDAETDLLDAKNRLSGVEDEIVDAKDRLLGAESRLSSIDDEIADAKDRLTGAESRLTATETDLTDARNRLTSVEGSINDAEARLVDAENRLSGVDSEIDGVKTRLTDAESDLEDLEGVVSTHETKISNVEGELSAKVSKTEFNALAGTVSTHGTTLAQHADQIAMKAEQSEVDTLSEAVASNTATLEVHATQIAARVTKEVYNLLENRVEEAEGELVALADEISAKVSQTVFEDLQSRVTANEAELLVQAEAIQARVTQEVYDTLANRVTTVEGTLEVLPEQIALKASQSEVDALTGRVEDAEAELIVLATEISSKVSQTVFDTLSETVTSQGTQITQNATAIESKADQSVVDALSGTVSNHSTLISQNATAITQKADKSTVDALTGRVSAAEATLSTHADEIAARATKEEVDAIEDRVTEAEGQLTIQAGKIEAKAEKSEVQALEEDLSIVSNQVGTLTTSYDSISARVAAVEGVTDDLTDEVSSVKSRTGSLEVRAGKIEASVSEIEEDIDEHGTRLTTAEANITAQAEAIALKAEKTEVYTKTEVDGIVDGIEIGGRNLLLDTSNDWKTEVLGKSYYHQFVHTEVKLEVGETYTFSVIIEKVSDDNVPINVHLGTGTTSYQKDIAGWRINNIEFGKKIILTKTITESDLGTHSDTALFAWRIRNEQRPTTVRFKEVKLEKGNKATDWTPAPEDIDAEINIVKNDVATLTTNYDSIIARVESTEGDIDTLTGEITGVKTRTGSLEARAGSIEASVSEIEEDIDEHGNRLLTVEDAVVNVLPGQIELKANASDVYTKTETDAKLGTKVDTTTYNQKVGELTASINGIIGRVENTETNIDNLTGEISSVKSNVASLEVRATGIESSVSSLDARVEGNENQLENHASLIQQNADGILSEVTRLDGKIDGRAVVKPQGGKLWHFDTSLESTDGIKPLEGAVATLRPNEGRFGGAVAVEEGTENLADIHYVDHAMGVGSVILVDGGLPEGEYTISFDYKDIEIGSRTGFLIYAGESIAIVPRNDSKGKAELTFNIGPNNAGKSLLIYAGAWYTPSVENHVIFSNIQIEAKPFATSFTEGTRPDGILAYPIALKDDYTIACYRKSHTDEDYKHVVKRSDGKVFVDGVEDSEYDVGWLGYDGDTLMLSNQTGLIDELLVLDYEATEEEIATWHQAKGAFVDQAEINYQQSQIVQLADEISFKVSRDDFDALENTVTTMGTIVTQTAEAVEQKAELSTVTELADNLSQVTNDVATLTTSYSGISARVESIEGDIDTLTGEVTGVKSRTSILEQRADSFDAKVQAIEEDVDGLDGRISTAESNISANASAIELRATKSEVQDVNGKVTNLETWKGQFSVTPANINATVSAVNNPSTGLSAAWSEINQTPTKISQAVASLRSDIDDAIADVYSEISQTAGSINSTISSLQTNLEGQIAAVDSALSGQITSIEQTLSGISSTVADLGGDLGDISTQVTQLADRYSVKTQKTIGGKTYATGFVSGINEQNESEFAVLADKFRVFGSLNEAGDGTALFVVDAQTNKAYLNVEEMIAAGAIKAKHMEADEIKTLLLKAEAGFFDEADILKIDAQHIYVGDNIELGDNRVVVEGYAETVQTIGITEDTYTSGYGPAAEQNFSTDDVLVAGEFGSETFMKIPLPSNIIAVEKATIWLYVRSFTLDTEWSSGSFEIAAVGSDWNYKTLTYNNAPSSQQRVISLDFELLQSGGFIGIDITEIVRDWVSGSYPNYGVRLRFPNTPSVLRMSSSRAVEAERPYLEISYLSESAPKETKVAIGDLEELPWLGGVIPQGTYGLYAKDAYLTGRFLVAHDDKLLAALYKGDYGGDLRIYNNEGELLAGLGIILFEGIERTVFQIMDAGSTATSLMNATKNIGSFGIASERAPGDHVRHGFHMFATDSGVDAYYDQPSTGKLNSGVCSGEYIGNGASSRDIPLPFLSAASLVIVWNSQFTKVFFIGISGARNLVQGTTSTNSYTHATGFRVSGTSWANASGELYYYVAFY